jgi:outer membrane protein OmpA-like peptidoglycan-associated protein
LVMDEDKPIASNKTKEGRQQNRRVEAVIAAIRTVQ